MEVAVTFGLFIIFVFGIVDLTRYFFSQQALTTLVSASARLAYAGYPFSYSAAPPPAVIATYAPLLDPTQVQNFTVWLQPAHPLPNGDSAIANGLMVLTVTATYNFTPITPGLEGLIGPMTATMTYQY